MTDKPTPTTDLLKRCAEIHEWRSTGVLSGEALRDYAKRKWPDRHDTLQMAEHETVTEALALLAKWGQPAQETKGRKVFVCTHCDGVYADQPVTRCDCLPDENTFTEGWICFGAPAQAAEPVAWAFKYDDGTWHDPSTTEHSSGMRPLFAAPQPVAREPLPKFLALKFHARRDKKATVTLLFPGHEAADAWVRGIKGGQHG